MKKRENAYAYIVIMVFALLIIAEALNMQYFSSKVLPLILSSIIFALGSIGLTKALLARDESGTTAARDETGNGKESRETWFRYSLVGTWVVGFFVAVYLVGFMVAIPLLLLSYLKVHGTRWRVATTFAVLTTAIVYGVFVFALKLYLYEGLLFS